MDSTTASAIRSCPARSVPPIAATAAASNSRTVGPATRHSLPRAPPDAAASTAWCHWPGLTCSNGGGDCWRPEKCRSGRTLGRVGGHVLFELGGKGGVHPGPYESARGQVLHRVDLALVMDARDELALLVRDQRGDLDVRPRQVALDDREQLVEALTGPRRGDHRVRLASLHAGDHIR